MNNKNKRVLLAQRNWLFHFFLVAGMFTCFFGWKTMIWLLIFDALLLVFLVESSLEYYNQILRLSQRGNPEHWVKKEYWPCPRAAMKLYRERPDLRG